MGMHQRKITDKIYRRAARMLKATAKETRAGIRLQAIISGKVHGIERTATIFNITSNTLRNWIKNLGQESRVAYLAGRGRKGKLTQQHCVAIKAWLRDDCSLTLKSLKVKLFEAFGLSVSTAAIHRTMPKLDLAYITPRPCHFKQSKKRQLEFKKKSASINETASRKDLVLVR